MICINRSIILLVSAVAALRAECLVVHGPQIVAVELAGQNPMLAALDPEAVLGASPIPGVVRHFQASQVRRFLAAPDAELPSQFCVVRATVKLDPEAVLTAVREAATLRWPGEEVRIDLLDYPRQGLLAGKLKFLPQGLAGQPTAGFAMWRGTLETTEGNHVPVWAKLGLQVKRTCPVATRAVATGAVLSTEDWRMEASEVSPLEPACSDPEKLAGRLSRRVLRPGDRIAQLDVRNVPAVRRGEKVAVEVASGAARLSLAGIAEADAQTGEPVAVRSGVNGRHLKARVTGEGKVVVDAVE